MKNEEASQVSRLEEEIRALKQKLIAQQQTASTSSLSSPSATHGASEAGRAGDNGEVAAGDGQGDGGGREGRSGDHGGGGGDRLVLCGQTDRWLNSSETSVNRPLQYGGYIPLY